MGEQSAYVRWGDEIFYQEIIDVDESVINAIRIDTEKIESMLRKDDRYLPEILGNVLALRPYIELVDPLGDACSGTLISRWCDAEWLNRRSPINSAESIQWICQCLGVAKSLLTGKAKVVKRKEQIGGLAMSNSIFDINGVEIKEDFVFVIMPFSESWSDYIWEKQIKPAVEKAGEGKLICRRADDLYGHDVMNDIARSIAEASVVIADMTGRNPNVFYELGTAHDMGKEVILISQSEDDIPFDLNRFRVGLYTNDGPGYERLEAFLINSIKSIMSTQNKQ